MGPEASGAVWADKDRLVWRTRIEGDQGATVWLVVRDAPEDSAWVRLETEPVDDLYLFTNLEPAEIGVGHALSPLSIETSSPTR